MKGLKYTICIYYIMIIPISNEILDSFPLKNQEYLVDADYYDLKSGQQEYRLYSYITTFFDNITILDIGTHMGRSAIALSHNETNKVISYNILDQIADDNHIIYTKKNITFRVKNVMEDLNEVFLKDVKIVLIDIDHNGAVEKDIINRLKELNFRGLVILDDTMNLPDPVLNERMRNLWDSIEDIKYDFTSFGHWSGTGVIVINDKIKFLL